MKYFALLLILLPFFAFGQVDTVAIELEVDSLFEIIDEVTKQKKMIRP